MLVKYTCSGQIANGHAYTLVAYTCGGQIAKVWAYTLIAYTCGGQIAEGSFQLLPRGPSPTPGSLWSAFRLLVQSKNLKTVKTPFFPTFALNSSAPWWRMKKVDVSKVASWSKLHFYQFSLKYSIIQGTFHAKNRRKTVKTPIFPTFALNSSAPWRRIKKPPC